MSSPSVKSPEGAVTQLFASLKTLCGEVSDLNAHYFTCTSDQVEYLFFNCLPNLDSWYRDCFVPVLKVYLQSKAKSQSKTDKVKDFSDLYITKSNVSSLLDKAFEMLNQVILYTPTSNGDSLCASLYQRADLHLFKGNLESALVDLNHALHFRPQSVTCISSKAKVLIKLDRHAEAYRQVSRWLKTNGKKSVDVRKIKQIKAKLAQYTTSRSEERSLNEDSKYHQIKVDARVEMVRNEDNQRLYFRACGYIPEGVDLIVEQPTMCVLKQPGLTTMCSACLVPCRNTFLPCAHCTEAIFCSAQCASSAAHIHRAECGVISLLQRTVNSKSSHVYRLLCQSGPENMLQMKRKVTRFCPEEYLADVKTRTDLSTNEVNEWFRLAQCDFRHLEQRRIATRTAEELAGAIFILCLYKYQMKLSNFGVTDEEVSELVGVLATELTKVTLTEFSWHDHILDKEQGAVGSFQCLVGSHITHACDFNADWRFKKGKLVIRSKEAIQSGQPIVITYGSIQSRSFFKRQAHIRCFTVMCACGKCSHEVAKNMAFRCDHCQSGPVPYHPKHLPYLMCMRCERTWSYRAKVPFLLEHFKSTEKLIWLAQVNGYKSYYSDQQKELELDQSEQQLLDVICVRMDLLAGYIFPGNEQWLRMVTNLCELLIGCEKYRQAVDWFQWLLNRFNILLCCTPSDPMEQLAQLDQWTTVYMAHIVQLSGDWAPLDEASFTGYIETGKQLFVRTFQALDAINYRTNLDQLVDNKAELLTVFHQAACDKWNQFKQITGSETKLEAETLGPVQFDVDDDFQFEVTAEVIPKEMQQQSGQFDYVTLSYSRSAVDPMAGEIMGAMPRKSAIDKLS